MSTIDWISFDSIQTASLEECLTPCSKELYELRSRVELINEDRNRLKSLIEVLLKQHSEFSTNFEFVKSKNLRLETENSRLIKENSELKKGLIHKDELSRPLISGNDSEKRHNSVNSSCAYTRRKRRPIVTITPTGFSQSFISK